MTTTDTKHVKAPCDAASASAQHFAAELEGLMTAWRHDHRPITHADLVKLLGLATTDQAIVAPVECQTEVALDPMAGTRKRKAMPMGTLLAQAAGYLAVCETLMSLGIPAVSKVQTHTDAAKTCELIRRAIGTLPDVDGDMTPREQYRRMFQAACEVLGAIAEHLGIDPDDGGAEPILAAIEELESRAEAAASTDPVRWDWSAIDTAIKEYLDDYEQRADEGSHTPTNAERFLIYDAVSGLLAEQKFLALLGGPVAARQDAAAITEAHTNGYELGLQQRSSQDSADAARYRWLRRWKGQEHEPPFTVQHEIDGTIWADDLDAAIDAAMSAGREG